LRLLLSNVGLEVASKTFAVATAARLDTNRIEDIEMSISKDNSIFLLAGKRRV
jgi:hypothetical protein